MEPASADETGEDESGIQSGSGVGMTLSFMTYFIWLFSDGS